MEISDAIESISSEINTDGSSESGDSDITKDDFSCGYVREPEYNEVELKSIKFSDDTKTTREEEEIDPNSSTRKSPLV